jgi:hypothetical protein
MLAWLPEDKIPAYRVGTRNAGLGAATDLPTPIAEMRLVRPNGFV